MRKEDCYTLMLPIAGQMTITFFDCPDDTFNRLQEWKRKSSETPESAVFDYLHALDTGATVEWDDVDGIEYFGKRAEFYRAQDRITAIQDQIDGLVGGFALCPEQVREASAALRYTAQMMTDLADKMGV